MLKAKEHCCEEAALGMGDAYIPCNKPATKIIRPRHNGEPDLRMCDFCADHSVRNRGMTLVGPYAAPPSYAYWQAAVRGEKPKAFVDQCELGFYRKSISEQNEKGNRRRVGWEPVAVFMTSYGTDDVMTARVGSELSGRDVTGDALNELWSYIATNAISEEWYRTVARLGQPWPDAHDPEKNKPVYTGVDIARGPDQTAYTVREPSGSFREATADEIARAKKSAAWDDLKTRINEGTLDLTPPQFTGGNKNIIIKPKPESPEQKLLRELAGNKAGVSQYEKIDSDTMAGQALSLKNTITSLAGDLDKIREGLVRPHVDAQAEINGRLNPTIKDAKAQGQVLLKAIGGWEDTKREAARRAQALADAKAREHAEQVRRAEEAGKPAPALPPAPVASNAPPPSTQVSAAVGRKASVKINKFVTSIDLDLAFKQFRNEPAVNACLIALAQRAVDAGLTVEGAVIDERSVVR